MEEISDKWNTDTSGPEHLYHYIFFSFLKKNMFKYVMRKMYSFIVRINL